MTEKHPSRRFFAAKAEVADSFIQMASRRNLTLYGLVSDILATVVDLDAMGGSLDEAASNFRHCKTSREIGFIPVPEALWYQAVQLSARLDEPGTMNQFGEVGEWIGKYVITKSEGKSSIEFLRACLAPLATDASEFCLEGDDTVSLRCINARQSQLHARLFAQLLTRAVETLGYVLEDRTVSQGLILLSFHRNPAFSRRHAGGELRLEALQRTSG